MKLVFIQKNMCVCVFFLLPLFCLTWKILLDIWFGSVDGQPQGERGNHGTVKGHRIQSRPPSSTLEGSIPRTHRRCIGCPTWLSGCALCWSQSSRNAGASQPCKQPGTLRKCTLLVQNIVPVVLLSYISIFFPFCPHYFHSVGVISIFRAKLPSVFHPQNFSSGMECWKMKKDAFFILEMRILSYCTIWAWWSCDWMI